MDALWSRHSTPSLGQHWGNTGATLGPTRARECQISGGFASPPPAPFRVVGDQTESYDSKNQHPMGAQRCARAGGPVERRIQARSGPPSGASAEAQTRAGLSRAAGYAKISRPGHTCIYILSMGSGGRNRVS